MVGAWANRQFCPALTRVHIILGNRLTQHKPFTPFDFLAVAACLSSFWFAAWGSHFFPQRLSATAIPIPAADRSEPALIGQGFAPDAFFSIVASRPDITGIDFYGSAVNGDATTGSIHTRWYKAVPDFYIYLCGYPNGKGNALALETSFRHGTTRLERIKLDANPENWGLVRLKLDIGSGVTMFRIAAADQSQVSMGWLGFSQPFAFGSGSNRQLLGQMLFAFLCAIASFVAILGPGIVARAFAGAPFSPVWLPVPGTLLMGIFGILIWKVTPRFPPDQAARWALCPIFLLLALAPVLRPLSSLLSRMEMRVLGFVLLVAAIAMGRGTYSVGPTGELYQNGISRTLESSDRGDSRIPYHVVQLVGNRLHANSQPAELLFAPWNFSSRGPISGLAASPLVLSGGGRPPSAAPVARWTVFDPEGFAAYRIFLSALFAAGLFVPFGLARLFLDEHWSFFAFLCAAAAPFTIH